jgi:hypothetical protein
MSDGYEPDKEAQNTYIEDEERPSNPFANPFFTFLLGFISGGITFLALWTHFFTLP